MTAANKMQQLADTTAQLKVGDAAAGTDAAGRPTTPKSAGGGKGDKKTKAAAAETQVQLEISPRPEYLDYCAQLWDELRKKHDAFVSAQVRKPITVTLPDGNTKEQQCARICGPAGAPGAWDSWWKIKTATAAGMVRAAGLAYNVKQLQHHADEYVAAAGVGLFVLLVVLLVAWLRPAKRQRHRSAASYSTTRATEEPAWVARAVNADEPFKMVFAVRQDLPMSKGKIAAQVGHAVLGAYRLAEREVPTVVSHWRTAGETKVTLKCSSRDELFELYARARSLSLPAYYVVDAGRTEIPSGSETVLAVGPGPASLVNEVTGRLQLL